MWLYKDLNMVMVVFVIVTVKVFLSTHLCSFNAPHDRRACMCVFMCVCFFNTYVISTSIVSGRRGTLPSKVHSGKRSQP